MSRTTAQHATHLPARAAARGAVALAALAALAGLLLLGATPARAGGPTSVLVVNYDGSRAAAALTGSRAYEDLGAALDVFSGEPPTGEPSAPADFMGTELRLTWLVHDVVPWRLDALRVDDDQIWVNTVVSWEGDLFDQPGRWHRPADEALLRATLTSMGVLGPATLASGSATSRDLGAVTAGDASPDRPVPGESAKTSAAPDAGSLGRPAWALAATGLVGLLLGWSGHRLAHGRGTRQPDGRSEDEAQGDAAGTTHPGEAPAQADPASYEDGHPATRFTLR